MIFLVRHLPTLWNSKGKLQGRADIPILPLDTDTKFQIDRNSDIIKYLDFETVLVSKLQRTSQTAKAYGFANFTEEPRLNEFDFGTYEGIEKTRMLSENPNWISQFSTVQFGESPNLFKNRLSNWLTGLDNTKNYLVFSHGAVIRALISISTHQDFDKMNQIHVSNNQMIILDLN